MIKTQRENAMAKNTQKIPMMTLLMTIWLGMSHSVSAQDIPSLHYILNHTYQTHPHILDGQNAVNIAHEDMQQILSRWKPTISLDASTSKNFTTTKNANTAKTFDKTSPDNLSLSMQYNLYNGGSDEAARDAQEQTILLTKTNREHTIQQIFLNTIEAYLTLSLRQQQLNLQRQNHDYVIETLELAKKRFALGDIRRTEIVQTEARLATSLARLTTIENQLVQHKATLYALSQIDTGDAILPAPNININLPNNLDTALDLAYQQNLNLQASLYQLNISKFNETRAKGDFLPNINLNAAHRHERGTPINNAQRKDTTSLIVNVNVPLYHAGVDDSRLLQANYRRGSAEYHITHTRRQIQQDVHNLWSDSNRLKAVEKANQTAISSHQIALDDIQQQALLGISTTLDILNARQELLEAQIAALDNQHDQSITYYRLLFTLGELTLDNLAITD